MNFTDQLLRWYIKYGRQDFPWQKNRTPYRVWVSEIMLQQTQVGIVIPYYQRFMKTFPNLKSLALANLDEVLRHWTGLGYYARARNLHKTAIILHQEFKNRFPKSVEALSMLPGIGRSTAGAIASFSMKIPAPILDGNVKRVLTRYYAISGWPEHSSVKQQLWQVAERHTPSCKTEQYNQAIMDLGALICTRTHPKCSFCPLSTTCKAYLTNKVSDFPTAKKARKKLTKQVYTLLLKTRNSQSVLLERRPPTGIWGGLWTFPECPLNENITKFCQQFYGVSPLTQQIWDKWIHSFSHFNLEINPVLLDITITNPQLMDSAARVWYKLGTSFPGGVSTPVGRLLKHLEENDGSHCILQKTRKRS